MNLFQLGNFVLHSGERSVFKIDCDALPDSDLDCLAYLLAARVPYYGAVEGVPTGGLRLAAKMVRYVAGGPLLIVDDVWTTGKSMIEHRAGRDALGAVLFARDPVQGWVTALFNMSLARRSLNVQVIQPCLHKSLDEDGICPLCGEEWRRD